MEAFFNVSNWFQILRWTHFIAGIIWIGLLYYFNFVQAPFLAKATDATKKEVTLKLLPLALLWFRWAAMVTLLVGLLLLLLNHHRFGSTYWISAPGIYITVGTILGAIMWFNVWFVIWPAQKIVIASASAKTALNVGSSRRKAFLASRTNTMLSFPLLFLMGASPHGPWVSGQATFGTLCAIIVIGVVVWLLTWLRLARS